MIDALPVPQPLDAFGAPGHRVALAEPQHAEEVMRLLADDEISRARGIAAPGDGEALLAGVNGTPGNAVVVVLDDDGAVLGTTQLTLLPGMTRAGATRVLVEAVRVDSLARGAGIGSALMRWVVEAAAPTLGARLVQLTSDTARTQAHRFYERLGFAGSHVGFKKAIER